MKNNVFRRLLAMAAAGAMLTSIAACGSSSSDDTASNGSDSTSLISVNNSEPQNGLIPSDTNEMGGGKVIRYLFEGLVSFDAKGKQHLEVAESITPNEDATTYTIKLKKGWKFTNGEAVTAHSFADTWSFAANVKNAQKTASRFSTIKGYDELQDPNVDPKATLSGLSTPDDYTLVVELNKPDSVFPTKLAHQSMFPLPSVALRTSRSSVRLRLAMVRTSSSPGPTTRTSSSYQTRIIRAAARCPTKASNTASTRMRIPLTPTCCLATST